jgi:hypothetical protein
VQVKEKGRRHAQTKRFYVNRAFGGHCHYCVIDGNLDARIAAD